jgi:hypothetical protein
VALLSDEENFCRDTINRLLYRLFLEPLRSILLETGEAVDTANNIYNSTHTLRAVPFSCGSVSKELLDISMMVEKTLPETVEACVSAQTRLPQQHHLSHQLRQKNEQITLQRKLAAEFPALVRRPVGFFVTYINVK